MKVLTVGASILRVCLDRTYFTEIENWKYCSKIIFKCVNNDVGFNKKVAEKWSLWVREQTVHGRLGQQLRLKKKMQKRGKRRQANALSKHSFNEQCFGYNFHKEYIGKSMVKWCSYSLLSHSCWVSIIKFMLLSKNN